MTKKRDYASKIEYKRYCSQQYPPVSSVDQFTCEACDSICPRTRKNVNKCEILKTLRKAERQGLSDYLDEYPDTPGGRPGGAATLHFYKHR